MAYKVKSRTSYGQRLSGSLKGIVTGIILFLVGTVLLFKNEGSFVKEKKAINETQSVTTHISDLSGIDGSLNGKVIHATALANTTDVVTDGDFGVSATALTLSRNVEYFQFEEHVSTKNVNKTGGSQETTKTYTYKKAWVSRPIDAEKFEDPEYQSANTTLTVIESETFTAENVTFDAYRLPPFMVRSISGSTDLTFELAPERLQYWENLISKTPAGTDTMPMVHQHGNVIYFGKSEMNPNIGDVRITFTKVEPKEISIIGKVNNNTFESYIAKNGNSFYSVAIGSVSAENMFSDAHSSNSMWTWLLRLLGLLLVMIGLWTMFSILPMLFKVLPFLGSIVGAGVGTVCVIFGFAWSLLIVSLAWLFFRPLIGIPLLLVAVAGIWYLKKKGEKKEDVK